MDHEINKSPSPKALDALVLGVVDELDEIAARLANPAALKTVTAAMRREVAQREPWEPEWD